MSTKPDTKPLPLSDTLRDLALLRASDVDLAKVLSSSEHELSSGTETQVGDAETGSSVEKSYEFVREARAVIKLLNRGDVELQGARLEELRSKLGDVLEGLTDGPA